MSYSVKKIEKKYTRVKFIDQSFLGPPPFVVQKYTLGWFKNPKYVQIIVSIGLSVVLKAQ